MISTKYKCKCKYKYVKQQIQVQMRIHLWEAEQALKFFSDPVAMQCTAAGWEEGSAEISIAFNINQGQTTIAIFLSGNFSIHLTVVNDEMDDDAEATEWCW